MVHFCRGSRVGEVMRASVARVRFRPGAICGLSLLLVLALLQGFFAGFSAFPPSSKTNIFNIQVDQDRGPARKSVRTDVASSLKIGHFRITFSLFLNASLGAHSHAN